ncbi:permease for cytosine/purines uracil thiamine allantoin [Pseudarthrobacter chlorophenolicus A6]|uniref:Permease for cytosine/purines uracil thiamine allantoin n=1 Tax=Pseudarthrobacter chlorophenolicus (strain ATCC 700700 / DSM 12829 / CIP 107037 / JCM 12360 / KCTC 9906 / NCIMB 13794 / A6) TaxID=452863 RepID=B8HFW2_PSECP|nr:NCS1 family nucleobase:cation symporter-1 [Pseudarthrobacter chlorophenolicus]ACL41155.1 permease for cytosine/purines uracil thiamine allantoin [Pseudarthrobacter chlorophenolicus A6]SDQ69047.1 nucleobase:cation symporter-1, NCS1 family [Pseudarthrobacter chlorophenolicus]
MQTPPPAGVDTTQDLTTPSVAPTHPSVSVDALCEAASAASGKSISPTLYNVDLAPTKREGRSWTSYSIFTLWANDVHSLGNYAFAIGLFALGLGGWQILLALGIGAALLFGLLTLSGFMGVKTGVPFPVMSRISFGIRGAQIASLLRGAVAVAWFGIQTYLASVVFRVMLVAMFPSLADLDKDSILGLSTLGWAAFLVLWVVQLVIVSFGMEMIRKYEAFAGPVILATMAAMAIWIFVEAGGSIAWSSNNALEGLDMWRTIFAGGALWVSIYGTFVLNFCDFTRSAVSKNAVVRGNFWGIPINMLLFGAIVVVMAGGQFKINGTIIQSPSDIVQTIPNTLFLVLACLALLILTIAVNLMANFVAPVYALTNLFPKRLNFRRAAVVSAVIGLVILPWNLYNNPLVILYFLGGLGALLGPLFGVVMADYWLIRRGKVNVPELYTASPEGAYYYRNGVNPRALIAMVPAAVVALCIAFVPALAAVAPFAWFFAASIAAAVYYFAADRTQQLEDRDGESIAVASTH